MEKTTSISVLTVKTGITGTLQSSSAMLVSKDVQNAPMIIIVSDVTISLNSLTEFVRKIMELTSVSRLILRIKHFVNTAIMGIL